MSKQWTNDQWENTDSITYSYDASGHTLSELEEQWTNNQWVNFDSLAYAYDANGYTVSVVEELWTNGQRMNFRLTNYTYDTNGSELTQLDEQWTNGQWINLDRTTYTYGPNGLETTAKYEAWNDSLWIPADGYLYFYDGAGNYSYYIASNISTIYDNVTSVSSANVDVPSQYALWQNYPNPFNPSTIIQFTVPSNGRAELKIFDVLGQEVATLFAGDATAGTIHQVQFNASNLSSGIYFSRLEFGGKMQVKKMLLLK